MAPINVRYWPLADTDFTALAAGNISSAVGSFDSVAGVTVAPRGNEPNRRSLKSPVFSSSCSRRVPVLDLDPGFRLARAIRRIQFGRFTQLVSYVTVGVGKLSLLLVHSMEVGMPNDAAISELQELKLNDKPLFPKTISEDGTIEQRLDDGTVIQATVIGSRIVGYKAYDSSGKPLQVRRMRIKPGNPSTRSGTIRCYYCICNPVCQCWPEECPIV